MNKSSTEQKKINNGKKMKNLLVTYSFLALSAIFYTFAIQAVMTVARVLPTGVGAIPTLMVLLMPQLKPWFGLLYLAFNLPLLLIFMKKIKMRFLIRTVFFLLVSAAISFIYLNKMVENWNATLIISAGSDKLEIFKLVWPMIIFGLIGGACTGLAIAVSFKFGGSTGGTDIVTYYFSTKKQMNIGTISFIVSGVILVISFGVELGLDNDLRGVWLPAILGSVVALFTSMVVINFIFPRYSKVLVEVHSSKIEEIIAKLKETSKHAFRISLGTSGYTGKEIKFVTMSMLLLETKDFVKKIKNIDENSWIVIMPVKKVNGKFNTDSVN